MKAVNNLQQACQEYLGQRRSTYEFRCKRYAAVYEKLLEMGLKQEDSILDFGAGRQDFGRFLREQGWTGLYTPVDGAIDGTDLNYWDPQPGIYDFIVSIEVLEHLRMPITIANKMVKDWAIKGVVITTPNSSAVDTLAIDPTHIYPLYEWDLRKRGWEVELASFFCKENDSILAWRAVDKS